MTSDSPIFVVGAPRTGTTLVKEILNRHPRIHLFDEVHFFERIWDARGQLGDLSAPFSQAAAIHRIREIITRFGSDKDVADVLTLEEYRRRLLGEGRKYRNLLRVLLQEGARQKGAEIWGDSSPQDILYLATIAEWYPHARIVALVRDPRAFLTSCKNYHRRGVSSHRERYHPLSASMLWRTYMSALRDAQSAPWRDLVHVVRYEALVDDPEGQVRALCRHVGVEYDPVLLQVEASNSSFVPEGAPGRSGIVATSPERWRTELTPTELWIGERIFGDLRAHLGYPPVAADGEQPPRPAARELARIGLLLPGWVFNLLFRSHKPFTLAKIRRMAGLLRSDR